MRLAHTALGTQDDDACGGLVDGLAKLDSLTIARQARRKVGGTAGTHIEREVIKGS
jgi:hypothetical protein